MNIEFLKDAFKAADKHNHRFIGIKVRMDGFEKDEVIINEKENFKSKLEYYERVYDEDLRHKFSQGIRIVSVASGELFDDIQAELID